MSAPSKGLKSLNWIIEIFSIVTAVAFAISAALNALTFAVFWRLNYFLIASPSDVLMSGFLVIGACLLVALFGSPIMILPFVHNAISTFRAELSKQHTYHSNLQADVSYKLAKARNKSEDEARAIRQEAYESHLSMLESGSAKIRRNGYMMATAISTITIALLAQGVVALMGSRYGANPIWYETGLNVSYDIDEESQFNHCKGRHVLWLGSSSAVIRCGAVIEVFHDLDGLKTAQRFR